MNAVVPAHDLKGNIAVEEILDVADKYDLLIRCLPSMVFSCTGTLRGRIPQLQLDFCVISDRFVLSPLPGRCTLHSKLVDQVHVVLSKIQSD